MKHLLKLTLVFSYIYAPISFASHDESEGRHQLSLAADSIDIGYGEKRDRCGECLHKETDLAKQIAALTDERDQLRTWLHAVKMDVLESETVLSKESLVLAKETEIAQLSDQLEIAAKTNSNLKHMNNQLLQRNAELEHNMRFLLNRISQYEDYFCAETNKQAAVAVERSPKKAKSQKRIIQEPQKRNDIITVKK